MKLIRKKLHRSINRSQAAYNLYVTDKKYYQAVRIKKANEKIYDLLELFIYECDEKELDVIHQYLFHLEDWFLQFEKLENEILNLESEFVFESFRESPKFPKQILKILKR